MTIAPEWQRAEPCGAGASRYGVWQAGDEPEPDHRCRTPPRCRRRPVQSPRSPEPAPERSKAAAGSLGGVSLRFSGVSMTFPDGTQALDDVSFEVRRGELVTIVGPSGCGKSTVLRLASGLLQGASGRIDVADGNIGYVFQDATLLPWRTVERNVELFCELHGMDRAERTRKVAEAIELVGLGGLREELPEAALGRHEDAGVTGPFADAQPAAVLLRRAVRRPRRDHPRAPQRRAPAPLPA